MLTIIVYVLVINRLVFAENKLGDVLKNNTKIASNRTRSNEDEESIFRQETHKLLSECGGESSNEDDYNDEDFSNHNQKRTNKNRRGSNFDRFGNNNNNNNRRPNYNNRRYSNERNSNEDSSNNNNNRNKGNRRYNNNNKDNSNKRSGNGQYNENQSEEMTDSNPNDYSNNYRPRRYNQTKGYNKYGQENGDCKEENPSFPFGNTNNREPWKSFDGNYDRNYYNSRSGFNDPSYSRSLDVNLRSKRSNDDSKCVSQCIFAHLEVLDNRLPSETLVIKWLQDHIPNDMKRIRALRETRRCFARLSTSDLEDGCEFSQTLSKCLNLELE